MKVYLALLLGVLMLAATIGRAQVIDDDDDFGFDFSDDFVESKLIFYLKYWNF